MASTTSTKLFLECTLVVMILFSFFKPTSAQIKGCPFDSIYSFGNVDPSTSHSMLDHIASAFHLPNPEPYSSSNHNHFSYGANFGVSGATAMSSDFFAEQGIPHLSNDQSIDAQFDSFTTILDSICVSHQKCLNKLQRALFFVDQIGISDYEYAFLQGKPVMEVYSYVPLVTQIIKSRIKTMIKAGATNFIVPGSLPLGCLPGYLTVFHSDNSNYHDAYKCHTGLNNFAKVHNNHLGQALMELRLEFPHVQIVYADYYKAFLELLGNHDELGFGKETLMKGCCGIGGSYNFDPKKMCGDKGVPVCSDPAKYIHWDGFHLTKEALKNVVDTLLSRRGGFINPELVLPEVMHCVM